MSPSSRTGGELLVECLSNLGVTTSFGVPGESYLAVLDALYDADIKFTLAVMKVQLGSRLRLMAS